MIVPFDACSLHHPVVPPPDTARACTGEYLMGRVTLVECRSCTQERTVQTTPADAMQATIVPLTTTRMSAAVLDVDLRAFCKQDAALRRGLSPGQAVKQYKFAGSDGLNVQAFRTLLSAYVFSEATALRVLRGWVLQCVTCGTRPSRGFTDCNLKAMRLHVASLRETPIKVPGGVVAQRDTTYEVERASASSAADARAASKHGKVTCGGLDWVAANSGVGRKLPLATTGASVSVCGHLHAMTVLPMTRGEVMTLPIYHLLYNALKYCTLLGQDVWCLLLAHMRAQSAADPAFADLLIDAASGVPPGKLLVELTETAEIADLPAAAARIARLRAAGSPVCLDDFGAGLTPAVAAAIPGAIGEIDRILMEWSGASNQHLPLAAAHP